MAILRPVFRVGQVYALALRESRVIPNALMQEHVDGPARGARFRSANPFFRDLLMTLDRLCRYSLSLAFCTENAALALRTPQDAALPCGGGHRSMARSSGGQGYVQHYSMTELF